MSDIQWEDLRLVTLVLRDRDTGEEVEESLLKDVYAENVRQLKKWGIQRHSPTDWHTILTEEVGELAKAILNTYFGAGGEKDIREEAIQVATLALKIAEMAGEKE